MYVEGATFVDERSVVSRDDEAFTSSISDGPKIGTRNNDDDQKNFLLEVNNSILTFASHSPARATRLNARCSSVEEKASDDVTSMRLVLAVFGTFGIVIASLHAHLRRCRSHSAFLEVVEAAHVLLDLDEKSPLCVSCRTCAVRLSQFR